MILLFTRKSRGLDVKKPVSGVAALRTIKLPPASSVKNIVKRSDTLRTFLHKYKYHITVQIYMWHESGRFSVVQNISNGSADRKKT